MVMDTRTTDKQLYGSYKNYWYNDSLYATPMWRLYQWMSNTYGCDGPYKQVVSERDGKFFPGMAFRANPCIITEREAIRQKSLFITNKYSGRFVDLYEGNLEISLMGSMPQPNPVWDQNLANFSLAKALAKSKEAAYDAGVMLVELRETLDFLKSPFLQLGKLVRRWYADALQGKFLKRRLSRKRDKRKELFLSNLAAGWLSYRYGILPLISDAENTIKLFQRRLELLQGMQRVGGGVESKTVNSSKTNEAAWGLLRYKGLVTEESEVKSHSKVYYALDIDNVMSYVLRYAGLHPTQFPGVIWEGVRLSFVVDWMFRVGEWLRAITPDASITRYGMVTSQTYIQSIECKICDYYSTNGFAGSFYDLQGVPTSITVIPGMYKYSVRKLERRVNTSVPVFPGINPNALNWKRTLDSLSLIWGAIPHNYKRRH